ncbi:hypothetical protein ACHAXS_014410 [Conticribra weissflogii]
MKRRNNELHHLHSIDAPKPLMISERLVLILVILSTASRNSHGFAPPFDHFSTKKIPPTSFSPFSVLSSLLQSSTTAHGEDASESLQEAAPKRYYEGHPALLSAISEFNPRKETDACRIFHGRGGLFPDAEHLTLDFYPPVFLLTSFQKITGTELESYGRALKTIWDSNENAMMTSDDPNATKGLSNLTWVYQCRAERGNSTTQLMEGSIPDPHIVTEYNGRNKFLVHLLKGQNHGLFLDMAVGRKWLQNKCESGEVTSVLNLFAYSCAFSIAALNGGADIVVNVDMSRGALKCGQRSHEINGLVEAGGAKFLAHDIFKTWGKMKKLGPYDCVVVDPPTYQKGSFVAANDYAKVIRRLPSLLTDDGFALLCLNAPELGPEFLYQQVIDNSPELCYVERLENPLSFASAQPDKALKVVVFQFKPLGTE